MATTRDETACEPCKHEKQCSILQKLADSINDTTRTVRNTSSLVLFAGLYLGLTLVFSTDENLLRDSGIALPQVGVGIPLSASYIVAPVIFLYLHFHLLFLLDELKRKIQAFKKTIKDLDPNDLNPKDRDQYWNWLSSSAFVQSFLLRSRRSPKVLVWLSVVALPLMLLFLVFLSFVRYQSCWITLLHKIVFILDLIFIALFRSECFADILNLCGDLAKKEDPKKPASNENSKGANQNSDSEASPKQKISPKKKSIAKSLRCVKVWIVAIMVVMVVGVDSPDKDLGNIETDQKRIWREDDYTENVDSLTQTIIAIPNNIVDAVLCKAWDIVCRYLDISNALPDVHGIDLHDRELRFAKFGSTKLHNANFRNADLRGAFLTGAQLQDADLQNAKLQGVKLDGANLQNANLGIAKLQGANLGNAQLQGADLRGAEFQDTNFKDVQLQRARLVGANLAGENLTGVKLQGAYLGIAKLQGSNLEGAQLEGANLKGAKLQGANLTGAQLQGTNLTGAQLQGTRLQYAELKGADLGGAQLQSSFGQPSFGQPSSGSLYLVRMPDISLDFPILHNRSNGGLSSEHAREYIKELLNDKDIRERVDNELTWRENVSLGEHIDEYIMKGADHGVFNYSRPEDIDFHKLNRNWPSSVDLDDENYKKAWVDWTVEFACKNQYTALSSLERWRREAPLYNEEFRIDAEKLAELKKDVRNGLIMAKICQQKCEPCFGLQAISSDDAEWKMFVGSQP